MDDVIRRALEPRADDSNAESPDKSSADIQSTTDSQTDVRQEGEPQLHDDIPSTVSETDAAEAIGAAIAHVEREGGASMREIVTDVMPEHPLGYDVPELEAGDRYRGSWWRRVIKPGLEAHDAVAKPDPGESKWRWSGG